MLIAILTRDSLKSGEKYNPTTLVFPTRLHAPIRKATKFHLFLYVQNRVKVRNPQGIAAVRMASWDDPKTTDDDDLLTVYGVNSGQNVVIFNTSMTTVSFYGLNERGDKRLNRPYGITASSWGDVYVADTGNDRIVKLFNPEKALNFEREIRVPGMSRPQGVSLTADSSLYVSDTGGHRVLFFRDDTLNQIIAEQGYEDGKVRSPRGIAGTARSDRWSYWKDDFVVVIDHDGQRLQKFLRSGEHVASKQAREFGYPDANLQYIAIDYYSNIWITDLSNHCIHKFDRNLNHITTFGRKGGGDKEFVEPRGITMNKQFGQVLVAEKEAAQYYWVGSDVLRINVEKTAHGLMDVRYFLTEKSVVTLEIRDRSGNLIGRPLNEASRSTGENREIIVGDGTLAPFVFRANERFYAEEDLANKPDFTAGRYKLKFIVKPTYSSAKYFERKKEIKVTF